MKRSFSWLYRCVAWAVCLAMLLPVTAGISADAAEEELYLRPLAGGVAQVAMSRDHIAVLRSDGTVAAVGNNEWGQCDVSGWSDIVKIWAAEGVTLGLTRDGELLNSAGTMGGWKDIVDVDAAPANVSNMTIVLGLKSDGTAVSMGVNSRGVVPLTKDVCNVTDWTDVVQVLVCDGVFGLKSDGTVLERGFGGVGAVDNSVSNWTGIRQLVKASSDVFGITQEGTVEAEMASYGCEDWENVVRIIPGEEGCVYGLTGDGRLLSGGENAVDCGAMANLVDAAVGANLAIGEKADRTTQLSREPQGMYWNQRDS